MDIPLAVMTFFVVAYIIIGFFAMITIDGFIGGRIQNQTAMAIVLFWPLWLARFLVLGVLKLAIYVLTCLLISIGGKYE